MPHSVSIIIAAGLFGLSSDLALAQQAPNRVGNSEAVRNPDILEDRSKVPARDTTRLPTMNPSIFSQIPVRQTASDQQIEILSLATRDAIKALTVQIESLKARVAQLESQQKR